MADQKVYINQLPPVNVNETALIPVFQGGVTSKATAGDIIKMATSELDEKLSFVEGNLSSQIIVNAEKLQSTFNKEITDVNGQVTELQTQITQTAEQIKLEASKEIAGVKKEVASLTVEADKIATLVERVEQIDGELVINRSQIEQQADSIKSTVEYLDSTNHYISTIEQTAQQIQAKVQSNDDKLGQLTLRADSFETVIAETNSNVQGFADTISQMNNDIVSQATKLDNVSGIVSSQGTSILQTSSAISTLAAKIQYDEATGTIVNISKSGLLTTAESNRLYTTKEEFNLNSERLLTCEASITTTAEKINTLVQKIKFDPATGEITNISKAGIVTTADGNNLYASKTEFNDLGQRVSHAETSILQTSNEIVLKASKDELVNADAQIRADLTGAINTASSQASSLINQLNNSLNENIASVNSSITNLSGELVNVENELIKDMTDLGNTMDGKLSDLEGDVNGKLDNLSGQVEKELLSQQTSITQNAEAINLNAQQLTQYKTANDSRILACESNITANANSISAISSSLVFDKDGNITNFARAGLVTESTYATLFAQYVSADTNIVKQAQISAFVTKNDMDQAISNIKLSADQIIFEGTTCINGNFVVDTDGNLTINGNINATSGTIGGFTIEGNSLVSSGIPFIRIQGATHYVDLGNSYGYEESHLITGRSDGDNLAYFSIDTSDFGHKSYVKSALSVFSDANSNSPITYALQATTYSNYATALYTFGRVEMEGSSDQGVFIGKLAVKNIGTMKSVASGYSDDFIVMPNDATYKKVDFPLPENYPGRIIFVKHKSGIPLKCVYNNRFLGRKKAYDEPESEMVTGSNLTAFYISDGTYWHQFLSVD